MQQHIDHLSQITANTPRDNLMTPEQTAGFISALATAPYPLDPSQWISYLWGQSEQAPFEDGQALEQYLESVINLWNQIRPALLDGTWEWPQTYALDEADIVNSNLRHFCEGFLQAWPLIQDDWQTLFAEESEENALIGGLLLSVSMLFDPESALESLNEQGYQEMDAFHEIYQAMPQMLTGLTQIGAQATQEK